jgi:transcriptional regulator with XRE-family HTH domain
MPYSERKATSFMPEIVTESEVQRNEKFLDPGLSWLFEMPDHALMSADLHSHLRAHRKARNLTLEAVADMIGVRFNTISQWETGKREVDLQSLAKLAKVYGIHPAALLLAPEDGPKFEAMRRASNLAERMGPDAAADWLRMGEHLVPPAPED